MNRTNICASMVLGLMPLLASVAQAGQDPTPTPKPSQLQTHLKIDLKNETKAVHFINTNNDPDVFTKTYVLKNADPYEVKPYIVSAIAAKRVSTSDTRVESIKYEDGTGILIVSAEDYRFGKQQEGMGIDEMVKALDMPELSSSSGSRYYFYFPKYWDAPTLKEIIRRVGMNDIYDPYQLQYGRDRVRTDDGLNCLFFYTPLYPIKKIEEMLKLYDTPTSEALINYTIYELSYENDGQIGNDFQAWKNGPGADLFAIGSRYSNGWDYASMSPASNKYTGSSYTNFVNFSPKWNTKYLDLLVTKSKAKVLTSGELSIQNSQEGIIQNITSLATIADGAKIADKATVNEYQKLTNAHWDNGQGASSNNNSDAYRISGVLDMDGKAISMFQSDGTTAVGTGNPSIDFVISRSTVNGKVYYYLEIDHAANAYFFDNYGTNRGKTIQASAAKLQKLIGTVVGTNSIAGGDGVSSTYDWVDQTDWKNDRSYTVQRDVQRITNVSSYGFQMSITPLVCDDATTLDLYLSNTSLVGFQNNGTPRTAFSEYSTKLMVDNKGGKFVVGGIEKKELVRSVSKVPWLGSIPVLGWAFGTEGETLKTSQIVSVIECNPVQPDTKVNAKIAAQIKDVQDSIANYGVKNSVFDENDYGFDQWLFDSEKTWPDPLP